MDNKALYPLQFEPLLKYRLWGGERLKSVLGKNTSENSIGESWEISAVKGDETFVSNGPLKGSSIPKLIDLYGRDFLGEKVLSKYGNDFPLLIKFIDAAAPLSIQVHPSDELAQSRHNSYGKNEMWYIMDSDNDAQITIGFNSKIDKQSYLNHLDEGTITDVLNQTAVQKGDAFYIPTGRVHAIGKGVMLAEIQQSSDITYRIYDYDRVDQATGHKRDLHNDLAVDVVDFSQQDDYATPYSSTMNAENKLIHSPYFKSDFLYLSGKKEVDLSRFDSFVIYMCVNGNTTLNCDGSKVSLTKGDTVLIPAAIPRVSFMSDNVELIQVYL